MHTDLAVHPPIPSASTPYVPPYEWAGRRWTRLRESSDPIASSLLEAARETRPVGIRYAGGSQEYRPRLILPVLLFANPASLPYQKLVAYCLAWCALREAPRLFRSDRIEGLFEGPDEPTNFPLYRALGETEREIRYRFQLVGEEIDIVQPTLNHRPNQFQYSPHSITP